MQDPLCAKHLQRTRTPGLTPWAVAAVTLLAGLFAGGGCGNRSGEHGEESPQQAPANGNAAASDEPALPPGPFHDRLLAIGKEYQQYMLVDPLARFAPTDCRAPEMGPPSPLMSESGEGSAHSRKLYYLFAKNGDAYRKAGIEPSPVGQVIVKEAWTADRVVEPDAGEVQKHASGQDVLVHAVQDGKVFARREQASLFVMFKLPSGTADTDSGWVYGTLSPDGKKVTGAGRVSACVKCHREAGADRLFGLHPVNRVEDLKKPKPKRGMLR